MLIMSLTVAAPPMSPTTVTTLPVAIGKRKTRICMTVSQPGHLMAWRIALLKSKKATARSRDLVYRSMLQAQQEVSERTV
jgi:hypothetical protein